jgi:hypothetical protein
MPTPTHDEQGRELLPDDEFERLHMLEPDEFQRIDPGTQQHYFATYEYHQRERLSGPLDPHSIRTSSGMSYQETLDHWRKMQSQTPDGPGDAP